MKKNDYKELFCLPDRIKKWLFLMKLILVFFFLGLCQVNAVVYAQYESVVFSSNRLTIEEVFSTITKQLKYDIFYSNDELDATREVVISDIKMNVENILQEVLKDEFTYEFINKTIIIKPLKQLPQTQAQIEVQGVVKDKNGEVLPGVAVVIKGTTIGVSTDMDGRFKMLIPKVEKMVFVFSFMGMKKEEVAYNGQREINVVMKEATFEIEEIIINGIAERKKESFTGSATTFKGKDLKMIGTQNVLQGLRSLDPAFTMMENNQFGSDPNKLPDIEIRGKSSIVGFRELYGEDPNQPLFILDGFETTLQVIMDLSMERVESLTILKDAASTAIYGAKAANGVIVVETKNPGKGKLRVNYNGSFDITMADLSDYNLMNAREKLEFERQSGRFESEYLNTKEEYEMRYNRLKGEIDRGVDTYWLSEPLRVAFNHRHNLYAEGGDDQMRYGIGITYGNTQGVMKHSGNDMISGNIDLLYRVGKFSFSNKFSLDHKTSHDPTVPFSEYASANPYYRKTDEDGQIERWLETPPEEDITNSQYSSYKVGNPLWNSSLNSFNKGKNLQLRNNFIFEWSVLEELRLRGRFGFSTIKGETENFLSPEHTSFDDTEKLEKGSYRNSRSDNSSYEADVTLRYGHLFGDAHQINAVAGAYMDSDKGNTKAFGAVGFPVGNYVNPSFANAYTPSGKPTYYEQIKRSVSFYLNGGYSYKNRYLLDFNIRSDGSSIFGSNKRFTSTWAVGLGWNLHNEKFISDNTDLFSVFRFRASIGNPGNQNFGSFQTFTTYKFDNWLLNGFGPGLIVDGYGNPNLEWQKTLDKNIGMDLSMFGNRFHVTLDYYRKTTDPLLALIGTPSSVGVKQVLSNVGAQIDRGFNGTIKYSPIYKPQNGINYTISLNFKTNKAEYDKIGNKLDQFNKQNMQVSSRILERYYDGGSPTALWSVKSEGIDPASGQEIFLKKDGTYSYIYEYEDEVEVGDSRPKIEGVFGNTLYYKGFSCSIHLRYSFGGDVFNQALYEKVENINTEALKKNQDKRALTDRWQNIGNVAKFKRISLTDYTPISSRFVMKNNYLSIESVRVGYEFDGDLIKRTGLSRLAVDAYMNDIARFSSIKSERGIDYPFARTMSFSVSASF